jgi:hypothetical protein
MARLRHKQSSCSFDAFTAANQQPRRTVLSGVQPYSPDCEGLDQRLLVVQRLRVEGNSNTEGGGGRWVGFEWGLGGRGW